jgi:hypothetical protein
MPLQLREERKYIKVDYNLEQKKSTGLNKHKKK